MKKFVGRPARLKTGVKLRMANMTDAALEKQGELETKKALQALSLEGGD